MIIFFFLYELFRIIAVLFDDLDVLRSINVHSMDLHRIRQKRFTCDTLNWHKGCGIHCWLKNYIYSRCNAFKVCVCIDHKPRYNDDIDLLNTDQFRRLSTGMDRDYYYNRDKTREAFRNNRIPD